MDHMIWIVKLYHLYIEILLNGVQKWEGWCIWYFGLIGYGLEEFAFDIYGENDFASNHLDSNFEYSHDHEKNWIYFLFKNWFIFEMNFQNHYKIELGSKSMPIGMNSMSWGYFDSAWYEHGPFVTLFSSLMPRTAHTASEI